jgi:AcrR family transcriptional regulator
MAEERRNKSRVLYAAADLFANRGYTGTAVREIVELAGVTKPTLYYYFKNKEDLYVQLLDIAMETFRGLLDESLNSSGGMRQRLVHLFTSIFELFREHIDLLRLVNSVIFGPKGATPDYEFTSVHRKFESVLRDILKDGIAEGRLQQEEVEPVIILLVGIIRSMQAMLVISPSELSFKADHIPGLIDLIFNGTSREKEILR